MTCAMPTMQISRKLLHLITGLMCLIFMASAIGVWRAASEWSWARYKSAWAEENSAGYDEVSGDGIRFFSSLADLYEERSHLMALHCGLFLLCATAAGSIGGALVIAGRRDRAIEDDKA